MKIQAFVLGVFLLGLLSSCASIDKRDSENPEEIFQAVEQLIQEEDYIAAKEHIDEIRKRFPQSRFSALAELRAGDIEFAQSNFAEAAPAYGTFVELYPKNPEAPYAAYRRAFAYFEDAPTNIARDQGPAKQALEAAEQLIKKYPNSEYAGKAKEIYEKARLRMAQKEAYIAAFYEKKHHNLSAYRRWKGITIVYTDLENFNNLPEAPKLLDEAKKRASALEGKFKNPMLEEGNS
jgi:outer membrane protein assembly factor BamD